MIKKLTQINKTTIITLFIIFWLTFLVSAYFSTIFTDTHHDGIMLKPALDVAQGKTLFKESFTQYGALTTYIQAISLKIFGEYLITIKITTAFFYGLISILVFLIWRRFLSRSWTLIGCLIWILLAPYYFWTFLPWSSVYALFFQLITIWLFIKYTETNKSEWLFLSGISTSLTFWCKQNVGGYTVLGGLLSILIISVLNRHKFLDLFCSLSKYCLGGLVGCLSFLAIFLVKGSLLDWWKQSIVLAFIFVKNTQNGHQINILKSLFPKGRGLVSIWSSFPVVTFLIFFKQLISKNRNKIIIILSIFSLFSWLQYYPITCPRHMYWAVTPMVGLLVYFIKKVSDKFFHNKYINILIIVLLLIGVFGPEIVYRMTSAKQKMSRQYYSLDNPKTLKGMRLSDQEFEFYSNFYQAVNEYEQKFGKVNIITTGQDALYLTLAQSENFHPLYVSWWGVYNYLYSDYLFRRESYIQNNQPLIVAKLNQNVEGYCEFKNLSNELFKIILLKTCNN